MTEYEKGYHDAVLSILRDIDLRGSEWDILHCPTKELLLEYMQRHMTYFEIYKHIAKKYMKLGGL